MLFPFHDWWVVPAKVAFDQTVWSGVWNSIYYTLLGFLRLESPLSIYKEWKATFWPMLTVSERSSYSTLSSSLFSEYLKLYVGALHTVLFQAFVLQ